MLPPALRPKSTLAFSAFVHYVLQMEASQRKALIGTPKKRGRGNGRLQSAPYGVGCIQSDNSDFSFNVVPPADPSSSRVREEKRSRNVDPDGDGSH